MALRIKREYIGRKVSNGNTFYTISSNPSDKEIMFVKNMISSSLVEEYDERMELAMAQVKAYMENE